MSEVTAPIMTDATGQSIDGKLNSLLGKMDNLAAAFQPNASGIVYSNTTSGLTGDDVQEAIDEMAADVSEIKQSLSDLQNITVGTPRKVGKWGNYDRYELWLEGTTPTMTANTWTQIKSYTFNTASIIEKIFTISDSGGLIFNDYNTSSTSYVTSYIKNDGIYLRVGNGAAFSEQKFYCKVTYVS